MKQKIAYINDIVVPKKMKNKKPKRYKIMGMTEYYKENGKFYGRVIVNKKYKILDGYVVYYTAKNVLKYHIVPITIVSNMDRIKHFMRKLFRKVGR